jgi:hypothetical protein
MIQDFARVLREKLRVDMNNYADDMAGGACKNYDEYQKLCGVIQGLATAESYLLALLEKIEHEDD